MTTPTLWVKHLKALECGPNRGMWRVKVQTESSYYPDYIFYFEPRAQGIAEALTYAAILYARMYRIEGVYLKAFERYNRQAAVFVPKRLGYVYTFEGEKS